MRRIIALLSQKVSAVVFSIALISCSAAGIAMHAASAQSMSTNTCNSVCSSHGQHVATNSQQNNEDEDEKEPAPPALSWPREPINLLLLYIVPTAAALWQLFKYRFRAVHLTTQLRF
ncbi:hypothetical protein EYC58_02700 [Candidatus Saccharibacteria bacterium]|nr:MAG: hypothetical protein EYC58_02700 [Candidatus Saccharibacteria bacterium]